MIQGFFAEHQEQLKGYVNAKELGKAVFNSGTYGLLATLGVMVIGNVVAHANEIFPDPTVMGIMVGSLGFLGSILRSLSTGKTVIPTATNQVAVLPANAPVAIVGNATGKTIPVRTSVLTVPANLDPTEREHLARELQKAVETGSSLGKPVVMSEGFRVYGSSDDPGPERVDILGKTLFVDRWTGAAFDSDAAYHAWRDSGADLSKVPGNAFVDDKREWVYTAKPGSSIHYETREETKLDDELCL